MPNRQEIKVFHDFFYIQDVYPLACKIAHNGILLIMSDYSLNRAGENGAYPPTKSGSIHPLLS